MARVTVEDCLKQVDNRFTLVHLASKRVQQLREGAPATMKVKNKEVVLALREVASGAIHPVSQEKAEMELHKAETRERERLAAARAAAEKSPAEPAKAAKPDESAEPEKSGE